MLSLYFFYIKAFFWGLFELRHFKEELKYDTTKGKNHRLAIRDYKRKLKKTQRAGVPKFEHVYLYLLFSAINEDDEKLRSEEFSSLVPFMVLWWYCLENSTQTEDSAE